MGKPVAEPSVPGWQQAGRRDRDGAFLKVNGYRLEFNDIEAFSYLTGLYEGGVLRFKELEMWLRSHATRCSEN